MEIVAFLILITAVTYAQVPASRTSKSDAEKIASAMQAGPKFVTQNATALDWPSSPGGEFRVLRTARPWPFREKFRSPRRSIDSFGIKKQFGKVDVLVNNAGTYEFAPLESITREHMQKHFNRNVTSLLLTSKEAVKLLDPDGGSVVNIASASWKLRACGLLDYTRVNFESSKRKRQLLGRIATPEDMVLAATFLASGDARWITGQVIVARR